MPAERRLAGPSSTSAFALVASRSAPGEKAAARARGAVGGSYSAIEGHISLAWAGPEPAEGPWRSLVVGRLWGEADPAALLAGEGAAALGRLRGRFALLAWEPGAGRALVAVDQLGAGAVFLCEQGGVLFAATELRELLRLLPRRPGPDRAAVARWISGGSLVRGQTEYEGVRRLEGGSVVEVDGPSQLERRYWAPTYEAPVQLERTEAAEVVRDGVAASVARSARGAATPGVLLSGGLDSASVAAAGGLAGLGELRGYSAVFPEHPTIDESGLVAAVAGSLGVASRTFAVGAGSMVAPGIEYLRRWGVPSVSPNLFVHRPLLEAAREDGVDVLLDGQGGDELFDCAAYLLADRVRKGRFASAAELARRVPGVGDAPSGPVVRRLLREYAFKGALPPGVHAAARRLRPERYAPSWLTPEGARLAVETDPVWEWKRLEGPRWWAHLADAVTAQRERLGAHDFLRRKGALGGIEGGHPLLEDLDLVRLVLGLPPELSFDARLDRPLLRAAMAGLVPDAVRLRREKSYFNALFESCLDGVDAALVRSLLDASDAEVRAYTRPEVVRALLLEPPAERRPRGWGWALWRLVGTECWLRAERDPGFLDRVLEPAASAP